MRWRDRAEIKAINGRFGVLFVFVIDFWIDFIISPTPRLATILLYWKREKKKVKQQINHMLTHHNAFTYNIYKLIWSSWFETKATSQWSLHVAMYKAYPMHQFQCYSKWAPLEKQAPPTTKITSLSLSHWHNRNQSIVCWCFPLIIMPPNMQTEKKQKKREKNHKKEWNSQENSIGDAFSWKMGARHRTYILMCTICAVRICICDVVYFRLWADPSNVQT